MEQLEYTVFPSTQTTIKVEEDENYGGAHKYEVQNCLGFSDGKTQYDNSSQIIQFVQKNDDGTNVPGVQSEQVALILLDRAKKLNARFPSKQFKQMETGLVLFIDACKERVQERIERGVMGDLKK